MSPYRMSKIESGIRVVLEFKEAFNRHDVTGMMALMSNDCVFESAGPAPAGVIYSGKEAITQYWQDFFGTSSEAQLKGEESLSLGERCVLRWKCTWKDTEGTTISVRGVDLFRVRDGLIREQLSYIKGAT